MLCENMFCLSERRVQQILRKSLDQPTSSNSLSEKSAGTRLREDPQLWIKYLELNLVKKSGEKSLTLRSPYSRSALYDLFERFWYPNSLDEQVRLNPDLLVEAKSSQNPTRFLKNILALELFKSQNTIASVQLKPETDALVPGLKCPRFKTFYSTLKKAGLNLVFDYVPHVCPMCGKLPEVLQQIKDIEEGRVKPENPGGELQKLRRKKTDIYIHQAQLQVQRGEITKIRENLSYTQCLIISDFCGHYTKDGGKMHQLIFVVYHRNEQGYETWFYRNFWSLESADWKFIITAWEMLFNSDALESFNEIYFARDNGSNYRSYRMLKYESEIGFRYKKIYMPLKSNQRFEGPAFVGKNSTQLKIMYHI